MLDLSKVKNGETFTTPDGTTLQMHSDRATRQGCKRCGQGSTVEDRAAGNALWWAAPPRDFSGKQWTLVGKDGSRHICGKQSVPVSGPEATPEAAPSIPADGPSDDDLDVLRRILSRPGVTPEQVREMVAQSIDAERTAILADAEKLLEQIRNGQPRAIEVKFADRAAVKIENVHPQFEKILNLVTQGVNVLMVGPKGAGKSTIIRNLATALGKRYFLLTCNPQMTKTDILGYRNADGYKPSDMVPHWQAGSVIGLDEYDTLGPHVQTLLNDAISSRELFLPNGEVDENGMPVPTPMGEGGVIVAAANTVGRGATKEYNARTKQDDASIDRFMLVRVDYDETLENTLVAATGASMDLQLKAIRACRGLRYKAAEMNLPYGWGVRAMVDICKAVQAGLSHDEIVYGRLSRGMPDGDWKQLSASFQLPVFA